MNQNKLKRLRDLFLLEEFQHLHHHDFFTDRLLIHSPLYLPEIRKGFRFLEEALQNQEKIFVFGDRDVDGITSTAIMVDYLTSVKNHSKIRFNNSTEGDTYGISERILSEILEYDPYLVIFFGYGKFSHTFFKIFD
jgi:single-stranded-DNA-specific exonuclease